MSCCLQKRNFISHRKCIEFSIKKEVESHNQVMKAWRDVLFVLVTRNSREHVMILKNDIALITNIMDKFGIIL